MVSESILQRLEAEFDNSPAHLRAVVGLLAENAPPLFIHRFRRDETGDLGEERILAIEERLHFLQDLDSRKEAILQQAEAKGARTAELQQTLADCFDQDQLDDIYQGFRPKRRTAGMQAEEKGLMPLALAIRHNTVAEPTLQEAAAGYVSAEKDLPSVEAVLEGVAMILAEQFASDAGLRAKIRDELARGMLKATCAAPTRKDAQRYKEFFDLAEPVRKIPAGRMLALRRAEREGILSLQLALPENRELEIFRERFAPGLPRDSQFAEFLDLVFRHAYTELVRPACENDIRRKTKEKADRETVRAFTRGLRSQLLAPPLGAKKALALRASKQSIWLALLGEDGSVLLHKTIGIAREKAPAAEAAPVEAPPAEPAPTEAVAAPAPESAEATAPAAPAAAPAAATEPSQVQAPEPPESSEKEAEKPPADTMPREAAVRFIADLIERERPAGLAVPHGRRQEVTDALVHDVLQAVSGAKPLVLPMDEAPSAIYATSNAGRKELHGTEVGIRTAISLARRLQDPLLELIDMDIKSLGLGQALAEVHQGMLQRQLETAISACVARIGLDLNRANTHQLTHLPGVSPELARHIVDHRHKHGGFQNLAALNEVHGVDATRFGYIAGFLRVIGGSEPLDAVGIHPENYELARRIATDLGTEVTAMFGKSTRHVELPKYIDPQHGRLRVLDVLHAISDFGRDPRGALVSAHNEGIRTIADLKPDLELRGRIANLTEFGAFVDLGIGQDGLIHISQIPASRLRDADHALRVGEVVTVYVNHVDGAQKRISLSMFRPRHLQEQRQASVGERMAQALGRAQRRGPRREPERPLMSRAARAPEGRRGGRRSAPRIQEKETLPAGVDASDLADSRPQRGFGRGRRDEREGEPRVFTVESGKEAQESRGFKGEFRSLAGLKALLAGEKKPEVADAKGEEA